MSVPNSAPRAANVIDIFHGDNNEKMPDWETLKKAGIFAVAHKCTQGTTYADPRYLDRMKAAKDHGLIWLAYHFGTAAPAAAQADYFLQRAHLSENDGAACDYEDYSSQMTLSQAVFFMNAVDVSRNRYCWIYSGNRIRETVSGRAPAQLDMFSKRPLWLAEYGPVERVPAPWKSAAMWQYSETGREPGIAGKVDLNVFHGTADDLRALLSAPARPANGGGGAIK